LLPRDGTLYLDELVVDTICPEPTTAMLLLLPAAVVLRQR